MFIGMPWVCTLSVLPFVGWGVARVGEAHSLRNSGPPPPPTSARGWSGLRSVPSPSRGFTGSLLSWQGVSVLPVSGSQSALNSVLALQDLVRTLYHGYFYVPYLENCRCPLNLQSCSPHGERGRGGTLVPQGLARDLCVPSFRESHSRVEHGLSFPFVSLLLWRRRWISSAPRFEGFTVLAVQMRAQSHWETARSSGAVRFSLAVTTPHRLQCERLFFPASLSMKEFSIFSVSLWLRTTMSVVPAFGVVLTGPSSESQVTVGIAPCLLLLKTFAVALMLKAGTWRKHTTFLLNYMRILAHRSLEAFNLGFVVLAFGPGFHCGRSPVHTCPSRTHD